jgi:hypothetical protein
MKIFKDHNIYIFDYNFDMHKLNQNMQIFQHKFEAYSDHRGTLDWWSVAREIEFDYATELCNTFNIQAKPRFYLLKANSILPMHKDHGTQCSINILMNSTNPAPVNFQDNKTYHYKTCLLNTQNTHGVTTEDEDRILFKLSIFNEDFETVAEKIRKIVE